MVEAIILAALIVNEHWVCAVPNKLAPSETIIFEFDVAGEELVLKSPAEVHYRIMRNDERQVMGMWLPEYMSKRGANLAVIDKQRSGSGCRKSMLPVMIRLMLRSREIAPAA